MVLVGYPTPLQLDDTGKLADTLQLQLVLSIPHIRATVPFHISP